MTWLFAVAPYARAVLLIATLLFFLHALRLRAAKLPAKTQLRRLVPTATVFVAALAVTLLARRPAREFRIRAPEGWLDLSRGAPESSFERVLPERRELLRENAHKVDVLAIAIDSRDDQWRAACFTALAVAGSEALTRERLEAFATDMARAMAPDQPESEARSVGIETIGGSPAGRMVITMRPARTLVYVLQGRYEYAVLTCTTPPEWGARYDDACRTVAASTNAERL